MDKVKEQLAVVARHSFWIMCGTILIVCLVSWYLSTKSIYELQQKQYSEITNNFKQMQTVMSSNPQHPNPKSAEGMAQPLSSSWNSAHQPSRIDRLRAPLSAAFMPEVPHASRGRRGLFSQMSQPG